MKPPHLFASRCVRAQHHVVQYAYPHRGPVPYSAQCGYHERSHALYKNSRNQCASSGGSACSTDSPGRAWGHSAPQSCQRASNACPCCKYECDCDDDADDQSLAEAGQALLSFAAVHQTDVGAFERVAPNRGTNRRNVKTAVDFVAKGAGTLYAFDGREDACISDWVHRAPWVRHSFCQHALANAVRVLRGGPAFDIRILSLPALAAWLLSATENSVLTAHADAHQLLIAACNATIPVFFNNPTEMQAELHTGTTVSPQGVDNKGLPAARVEVISAIAAARAMARDTIDHHRRHGRPILRHAELRSYCHKCVP
jgi:hypothetical protein